jgi:hypothetical protein
MITRFLNTACLLGALSAFTLAANAQTAVRATVPFEFAAGGAMLPAGEYTVDVPDAGVLLLHGAAGNSVALLTVAGDALPLTGSGKLLFERRDGMTYLSAVAWPSQSVRVAAPFMHLVKPAASASLH